MPWLLKTLLTLSSDPNPTVLSDLRFRRAVLEAVDRQQLVDSFMAGRTSVAHSFVSPDTPDYKLIEPSIVRYAHDPRRAAQVLAEMGLMKGPDGSLREPSGRVLSVEIKAPVQNDIHGKTMASVADDWQRLGLAVEQMPIPIPRMQDREYVAAFPGFHLVENGMDTTVRNSMRFHSTSTPLPENRFLVAGNYSRYRHPELDAGLDAYVTTIPRPERMAALAGVVRHMSENLSTLPLIHTVTATVVANRIQGVTGKATRSTEAWNAHEWDVN